MNQNILIAVLIIAIVAIVGIFVLSPGSGDGKINTQINFLSESTLHNGDQIQIELKDAQGNALANQVVNFTYQANGHDEKYSVVTNNEGKAFLVLSNEDAGDHQVTVSYGGDAKYNSCTATQTITVADGESSSSEPTDADSTANTVTYDNSSSSGSSGSSSQYYYDAETGNYYDSNGVIVGGQNDGSSLDYIKDHPQSVDENGS